MPEVTFEEFSPPELRAWLERRRASYIAERVAAGDTPAEATADANASFERLFPGGDPAPGQLAGWVLSEGRRVGELFVGPRGDDPARWWVWSIEIAEGERGRGLGRRAMELAEVTARAHGADDIGLNVFATNAVARGLYQSLGYAEASVHMRKALTDTPAR